MAGQAPPVIGGQQPEQVIIQGQRPEDYKIEVPNLSKLTEPLLDTPQSIQIISNQVLQDRAVTNLNDALRNVPGISLGAGEFSWQGNNPSIRGFVARTDMFLDGIRDFGSYYRDAFNLQQIEVLEGPSSILFGRGSTGGVINQVSKLPSLDSFVSGTLTFGTDLTRRATVDVSEQLPDLAEGAALRMTAMGHQQNHAGRDVAKDSRYGFAPSLALGLGTPTRLTGAYFHQSADDVPDYGLPWFGSAPDPCRARTSTASPATFSRRAPTLSRSRPNMIIRRGRRCTINCAMRNTRAIFASPNPSLLHPWAHHFPPLPSIATSGAAIASKR
jgi:catecholate siderophore receptor